MAFITILRGDDNRDELLPVLERIRIIFFGPMTIDASHIVGKMLTRQMLLGDPRHHVHTAMTADAGILRLGLCKGLMGSTKEDSRKK